MLVNWYHALMIDCQSKWADTFLLHSPINNDEQEDVAKIDCFKEYLERGGFPLYVYWDTIEKYT